MSQIILTILKEDILKDNYIDSRNCPITKALHRAGYTNLKDHGVISGHIGTEMVYINNNNPSYNSLIEKLFGMYNSFGDEDGNGESHSYKTYDGNQPKPIPVETFTHTIEW